MNQGKVHQESFFRLCLDIEVVIDNESSKVRKPKRNSIKSTRERRDVISSELKMRPKGVKIRRE